MEYHTWYLHSIWRWEEGAATCARLLSGRLAVVKFKKQILPERGRAHIHILLAFLFVQPHVARDHHSGNSYCCQFSRQITIRYGCFGAMRKAEVRRMLLLFFRYIDKPKGHRRSRESKANDRSQNCGQIRGAHAISVGSGSKCERSNGRQHFCALGF